MVAQADTLTLIRTSFSGQDELIDRAFRESRSFRSLCEDYRECTTALARWKRTNTAEAAMRIREYEELLVQLDREIQAWLEGMTDGEKECGSLGGN